MLIFRIGLQDIEKMKIMLNERHFPSEHSFVQSEQ